MARNPLLVPVNDAVVGESRTPTEVWAEYITALAQGDAESVKVAGTVDLTEQSAAISSTAVPIQTVHTALYRVSWYARVTTAGTPSETAESLADGIAAHFELGADGTEETGAITVTLAENGSPTYAAGLFGDAVTFGAATDGLILTNAETNGAFDFGTGDFAIHCKFKRSATTGTSQVILDKLASFLGFTLWFISTDKIRFNVGNGASSPSVDSSSTVTDTDWHSVSIFRVSGTVSMYLDGQFENSASLPGDVDNTNTFAVGHRALTASFIGTIDQVLFHDATASFYGNIAGAAAAYHAGTVGSDAEGIAIGFLTVTLGWTESGVSLSSSGAPITGNTTATTQSGSVLVLVDGDTDITYSTAYSSAGDTAMEYRLRVVVELVEN